MIKTTGAGIKPNLHIKKIDFMKEYLDFCYSHATTEGEIHHIIPKVILEKRIADQMIVRLSKVDHITAHWLKTKSPIPSFAQFEFRLLKKILFTENKMYFFNWEIYVQ